MLFTLLLSLYLAICLLLILLVLVQKGKGSMGIGTMGGGVQMLFGGSGGQDIFQKVTWVLGAIFMAGSLMLSLMKTSQYQQSRYFNSARSSFSVPAQTPTAPGQ